MARARARAEARVLWLSAETPDRHGGGGQRRQYHQIRALVDGGVDLHVASLAGGQDDASLREIVRVVRFAPAGARGGSPATLDALLAGEGFDRAVVAHIESVPHVQRALARHGTPWLLDFQNVNSRWHRARREPRRTLTWLWRERAALARADLATACSPQERDALLGHAGGTPVAVAGNGIAPEEWPADAISLDRASRLALFGSWGHTPNREGAEWLCRDVWPAIRAALPEARLLLAGPGEPPPSVLTSPGVEHCGRVADLARLLGGLTVSVVPIVTGIGSRVKFGEALASGAAVVSTTVGAEGFDAEGAFLRADAPDAFAQACVSLLREPAAAAELGRAGRKLAFERFAWQRTSAPLVRWALDGDTA